MGIKIDDNTPENLARVVVIAGIKEVPVAGKLVSELVGIFWKEAEDVVDPADQIKDRTKALIDKALVDLAYELVQNDLDGFQSVLEDYKESIDGADLKSPIDQEQIRSKYNVALGLMEHSKPHFRSKGYELALLPLFAQLGNLHLALLRDGINFGKQWGWTPEIVKDTKAKLTREIKSYGEWVAKWYAEGLKTHNISTDPNVYTNSWHAQNKYIREMTLLVKDHAYYWPYFDSAKGSAPPLTRIIFSDPMGWANSKIEIEEHQRRLTELSIWAKVDLTRPSIHGKDGAASVDWDGRILGVRTGHAGMYTGRSGTPDSAGWSGPISVDNPVVEVSGFFSSYKSNDSYKYVQVMYLKFRNGTETKQMGGKGNNFINADEQRDGPKIENNPFSWKFKDHILSEVYMTADGKCMILGFRLEESYPRVWSGNATGGWVNREELFLAQGLKLKPYPVGIDFQIFYLIRDTFGYDQTGYVRNTRINETIRLKDNKKYSKNPELFFFCELNLKYEPPGRRIRLFLTAQVAQVNGYDGLSQPVDFEFFIEADWTHSSHTVSLGPEVFLGGTAAILSLEGVEFLRREF